MEEYDDIDDIDEVGGVEDIEDPGGDIENLQRHADDVRGCTFSEVTSGKSISFTTSRGDRYTISKRSDDGLTMYLRCAICKKGRKIERASQNILWANATMAQMESLHGQ